MEKICHPLLGVCIILNLIADHLNKKEFISPVLKDEIPDYTKIIYKSALDDSKREDALPIVTYKSAGSNFQPYNPQFSLGVRGGTSIQLNHNLSFKVSTTNEGLTNELSLEIGGLIASLIKDLRSVDVYINAVDITETQRDDAKYYIQNVNVSMCLGFPVWKTDHFGTTLRLLGITNPTQ